MKNQFVTIRPVTQREQQIAKMHGTTGWMVLDLQDETMCFDKQPGVLVTKNNHVRWVKLNQVMTQ